MEFAATALSALAGMGKTDRKFVLEGIRIHLIENDPSQVTRNKFVLKRPSVHAERELRLNNWRVFYTVMEDGALIVINHVGMKRNNKLFIAGEEFEL